METPLINRDPLPAPLRQLLSDKFRLGARQAGDFTAAAPLVGGRPDLDSPGAPEPGFRIEKKSGFTLTTTADAHRAFARLGHLGRCIRDQAPVRAAAA